MSRRLLLASAILAASAAPSLAQSEPTPTHALRVRIDSVAEMPSDRRERCTITATIVEVIRSGENAPRPGDTLTFSSICIRGRPDIVGPFWRQQPAALDWVLLRRGGELNGEFRTGEEAYLEPASVGPPFNLGITMRAAQ